VITDTAAPTGFIGWIQANGQLVLFFAQLIYWLVICVALVWATLLFRKLVNAMTAGAAGSDSASTAGAPAIPAASASSATVSSVSVDEFVD
jgi:hypothetical protein